MIVKKALITGADGQDGFYLSKFLEEKEYKVFKTDKNTLDISDSKKVFDFIKNNNPDEIYNLAAQSHVGNSFKSPETTIKINSLGVVNLLDSIAKLNPKIKFFQASSICIYDLTNPYALSKKLAHDMVILYRNKYGIFAVNGILSNHESPMRDFNFVTQKITYAAACAKLGINNSKILNEEGEPIVKNGKVQLGNLDAERDWGFARDYVEGMWKMMQAEKPDDFVLATGEMHTIKELCEESFSYVGLNWEDFVVVDKRFVRSTEIKPIIENPEKAKKILGWEPKTNFKDLVKMMVDSNVERLK